MHRGHPLRPFLADWTAAAGSTGSRLAASAVPTSATCWPASSARTRQRPCRADLPPLGATRFFAEELLAATCQGDGDGRSLPPSLQNVLLSRVHDLPEEAQATLRLVAAAGGRVEHELLVAVSDLPEAGLLAALAAVAHQLLVPDAATETYALRHTLTQEALYGELLPGERSRLHAAFARVLAERPELVAPARGAAPPGSSTTGQGPRAGLALPAALQADRAVRGRLRLRRRPGPLSPSLLELRDYAADAARRLDLDHATASSTRPITPTWPVT